MNATCKFRPSPTEQFTDWLHDRANELAGTKTYKIALSRFLKGKLVVVTTKDHGNGVKTCVDIFCRM